MGTREPAAGIRTRNTDRVLRNEGEGCIIYKLVRTLFYCFNYFAPIASSCIATTPLQKSTCFTRHPIEEQEQKLGWRTMNSANNRWTFLYSSDETVLRTDLNSIPLLSGRRNSNTCFPISIIKLFIIHDEVLIITSWVYPLSMGTRKHQ